MNKSILIIGTLLLTGCSVSHPNVQTKCYKSKFNELASIIHADKFNKTVVYELKGRAYKTTYNGFNYIFKPVNCAQEETNNELKDLKERLDTLESRIIDLEVK